MMHKAIKPVSDDDGGVETHDGIASLPLKSIAELEPFEILLKNDGNLWKLVESDNYFLHLSMQNQSVHFGFKSEIDITKNSAFGKEEHQKF